MAKRIDPAVDKELKAIRKMIQDLEKKSAEKHNEQNKTFTDWHNEQNAVMRDIYKEIGELKKK